MIKLILLACQDFNWGTSPMWSTIDTLHQHCNGKPLNATEIQRTYPCG